MAKLRVHGGAEIDVATTGDIEDGFKRHRRLTLAQMPILTRETVLLAVDGAGNVGGGATGAGTEVKRARPGQRLDFLRVLLHAQGATPAAPLTGGWLWLAKDIGSNPPEMFWPQAGSTTVAPSLYTDGDSCLRLWGGERLLAFGAGLTANTPLMLRIQYRIVPDVAALRGGRPGDQLQPDLTAAPTVNLEVT